MGEGFKITYSGEFWVITSIILQQDKEVLEAMLKMVARLKQKRLDRKFKL